MTKGDKLLCVHGFTITPAQPQGKRSMKIDENLVLVEEDVLNATSACKGFLPSVPRCTKVTSILSGKAQNITVDGEAPLLLETLMVITDAGMAVTDPASVAQAAKRSAHVLLPTGSGLESKSDSTPATTSASQERKDDEDNEKSQEKPRDDQSLIYLRIIERHTQARVPNVRLSLKLANGQTFIAQSDGNGEIRLPNVAKGNFSVSGLTLKDMIGIKPKWGQLVGGPHQARADDEFKLEVKTIPDTQLKKEKEKAVQPISLPNVLRPDGTVSVARIEAHRVKDNDSLGSLAKHYGTDWTVIAHYNWGTIDPERINAALRDEVGCTQMDKENKNYRFSNKDVPGIVFVPVPWSQDKLETDKHYLLQLELMPAYRFALVDEAGDPFPEIKYDIRFANGKEAQTQKLSHRGRGLHLGAPPGPVTITYPDPDDIRVHWLTRELAELIQFAEAEDVDLLETEPTLQDQQPPILLRLG